MENWQVSPRHDMNSMREGNVQPLDVFEDAIQGWLLNYASKLVDMHEDHAGMAVMNLVAAYPETRELFHRGRQQNNSKYFSGTE